MWRVFFLIDHMGGLSVQASLIVMADLDAVATVSSNPNNLQTFQLIVARYLLGVRES